MPPAPATDLSAIVKDSVEVTLRADNLLPLLVDAFIVISVSFCSAGVLAAPLLHGYTAMCLRAVRGEKIAVGESFRGIERLGPNVVLGLALGLLLALGTALPVVGNLAVLCVLWWCFCVSVERPELGAVDVLKAAFAVTRARPVETLIVAAIGLTLTAVLGATMVGAVPAFAFTAVLTAVAWSRISR